jgi:hypothetical protein
MPNELPCHSSLCIPTIDSAETAELQARNIFIRILSNWVSDLFLQRALEPGSANSNLDVTNYRRAA